MSNKGGEIMRELGDHIQSKCKGFGFALLVFPFGNEKLSNYISNAERADMIKALRETADRLESKQDFITPNSN